MASLNDSGAASTGASPLFQGERGFYNSFRFAIHGDCLKIRNLYFIDMKEAILNSIGARTYQAWQEAIEIAYNQGSLKDVTSLHQSENRSYREYGIMPSPL